MLLSQFVKNTAKGIVVTVSILVVMDVALAELLRTIISMMFSGLNPCCNGCCSRSSPLLVMLLLMACLNPCCNGCCSRSAAASLVAAANTPVSILVVMDVALAV